MDPAAASPSSVEETLGSSIQRPPGGPYLYADVLIRSAWSLGALPPAEDIVAGARSIAIDMLAGPPREPSKTDWVHHWPPYAEISLALSREGGSSLLRFPGLVDFAISNDGCQIEVWPSPLTRIETFCHLLLDQVLPRVLAQQGRLVVHAGAARVGDQAIAFIGDTGSGKSTLTASLYTAGYPLLTDDGLVLMQREGVTLALPTYPSLRLWPDAIASLFVQAPPVATMAQYSSKRRIIMTENWAKTEVSLPLASFYVIERRAVADDASVSLNRLSPSEACMAIMANSFQLDVTDRRRAAKLFAIASSISEQVPVFSLVYPREYERLPEVHEAILTNATNEPRGRAQT